MSAFHKHFNDPAGAGVLPAVPAIPEARPYDENWVLLSGFLILFMQFGFALVEAGSVRYKNSQSIAIKVVLGLFCTILIWWLVSQREILSLATHSPSVTTDSLTFLVAPRLPVLGGKPRNMRMTTQITVILLKFKF